MRWKIFLDSRKIILKLTRKVSAICSQETSFQIITCHLSFFSGKKGFFSLSVVQLLGTRRSLKWLHHFQQLVDSLVSDITLVQLKPEIYYFWDSLFNLNPSSILISIKSTNTLLELIWKKWSVRRQWLQLTLWNIQSLTKAIIFELFYYINGYFGV